MSNEYNLNKKELKFIPIHLFAKGYIFKNNFIFEKKKIKDFAIFIGANEEIAEKKLRELLKIIRVFKRKHAEAIDKILEDEERHAEYSLSFVKKYNNKIIYSLKFFKENLLSKLRHFYANNLNRISVIFNPILYFLLFLMFLPCKFLKLDKEFKSKDIIKNFEPNSIL